MDLVRTLQMLEVEEGRRLTVYDDATGLAVVSGMTLRGNPTIGVGRCLDSHHGLSSREVDYLLANDVQAIVDVLAKAEWWASLNPARQCVLVCMAFQLGIGGALSFVGMIGCIKLGQWQGAAQHMLDSHWAQQTPGRAQRMARLMETGSFV